MVNRPSSAAPALNPTIDLNSDLGESYGNWHLGDDRKVIRHISSANVACGFHAGDYKTLGETVRLCAQSRVAVGAHPAYPDLLGFGRRSMALPADDVEALVRYQIGAVYAFCRAESVELCHVKAHGALYNDAAVNFELAMALAKGVAGFSRELRLYGLATSEPMAAAAAEAGIDFVPEAFADRRYLADGTLQSRSQIGAMLTEPADAAEQAVSIVVGRQVLATDGSVVPIRAATICCHGDTPGAPDIAAAVAQALRRGGVTIAAPD